MKQNIKKLLDLENAESVGTEKKECQFPVDRLSKIRPSIRKDKLWQSGKITVNVYRFRIPKPLIGWNTAFLKKWMAENLIRYIKLHGEKEYFYLWAYQDALSDYQVPEGAQEEK